MLVTLAYCLRDHDITLQLINWMAQFGDYKPRHTLLLCHDHRCPKNTVQAILDASKPIFADVRDLEAKADIDGWPEGANYMFRTIASYLANNATNIKHFLWLEPDAIPLKPGWLDQIEDEYSTCGKPFLGDRVEVENIPLHMSGVGVYPNPIYNFAGEANRAADTAWDMSAKDQIVPQAYFTKLIEHAWRHPTFATAEELSTQIRPEAVLFHASKDGSLIRLLATASLQLEEQQRSVGARGARMGLPQEPGSIVHTGIQLPVGCPSSSDEGENPSPLPHQLPGSFQHHDEMYAHSVRGSGPIDAWVTRKIGEGNKHSDSHITTHDRPTTKEPDKPGSPSPSPVYDIFIRTYPVDYPWLQFCLRSIAQYATGFRKIWIISPEKPVGLPDTVHVQWKVMNEESEDGYLSQQIHKLYADTITGYEADYILHIDSDTLFTRPVTPKDFFGFNTETNDFDKLIWYYTPYEHTETPWKVITQKFLGEDPPHEFMRRLPMMIPSWLYPELRTFCFEKHKKNLGDYVRAQPYREFSEFNALGAYAWAFHHDKFHWVNTMEGNMPPPFARQFFSWGGLTDDVKAEIQNILSGVPVLAEPQRDVLRTAGARESTTPNRTSEMERPDSRGTGQSSSGGVADDNRVSSAAPPSSPNILGSGDAFAAQFNGSDDETPGDHVRWLERYTEGNPSRRQYVMGQLKKARLVPLKRGKVKQKTP